VQQSTDRSDPGVLAPAGATSPCDVAGAGSESTRLRVPQSRIEEVLLGGVYAEQGCDIIVL